MIPLKVAATSVKFAMPPPTTSALKRPSGFAVAQSKSAFAYRYVSYITSSAHDESTQLIKRWFTSFESKLFIQKLQKLRCFWTSLETPSAMIMPEQDRRGVGR